MIGGKCVEQVGDEVGKRSVPGIFHLVDFPVGTIPLKTLFRLILLFLHTLICAEFTKDIPVYFQSAGLTKYSQRHQALLHELYKPFIGKRFGEFSLHMYTDIKEIKMFEGPVPA